MNKQHQKLSELVTEYISVIEQIGDELPGCNSHIHNLNKRKHELELAIRNYTRVNKIKDRLLVCGDKAIEVHDWIKVCDVIIL